MYFPVNSEKIFKGFFIEQLWWLLLSNVAKLKEKKNRTQTIQKLMESKRKSYYTRIMIILIFHDIQTRKT